jgi:hypothetical protein
MATAYMSFHPNDPKNLKNELLLKVRSEIEKSSYIFPQVLIHQETYTWLAGSWHQDTSLCYKVNSRLDLLKKGLMGYLICDNAVTVPIMVSSDVAKSEIQIRDQSSNTVGLVISFGVTGASKAVNEDGTIDSPTDMGLTLGLSDSLAPWLYREVVEILSLEPPIVRVNGEASKPHLDYLQGLLRADSANSKPVWYKPHTTPDSLNPLHLGNLHVGVMVVPVLHDPSLEEGVLKVERSGTSPKRFQVLTLAGTLKAAEPTVVAPEKIVIPLKKRGLTNPGEHAEMIREVTLKPGRRVTASDTSEDFDGAYHTLIADIPDADPSILVTKEAWKMMETDQAVEAVASGRFNLYELEDMKHPHIQVLLRKYGQILGMFWANFPELEEKQSIVTMFVLDSVLKYPNARLAIKKQLEVDRNFWTPLGNKMFDVYVKGPIKQGLSIEPGCNKKSNLDYTREVFLELANTVKAWYEGPSLVKGSSPAAEKFVPIANRTDDVLLQEYSQGDPEVEEELERRSKGRPFLVFKDENYLELDVEETLSMLKDARKGKTTSVWDKNGTSAPVQVLSIRDNNWRDRYREVCPLDSTSILFKGFCSHCMVSLRKVDKVEREMMALALGLTPRPESLREALINMLQGKGDYITKSDIMGVLVKYVPDISRQYEMAVVSGETHVLVKMELPGKVLASDRMVPFFKVGK